MVPEGRGVFGALTVRENLRLMGADAGPALDAFPVLAQRLGQRAGSLSGGEQQMLALARCWLSDPACVLLDEVSMGLAPRVVDEIYDVLGRLAASGVALLIVEQHVERALAFADRVHVLDRGRTAYAGPARAVDRDALTRGYLAVTPKTHS
jgi:branched-chain amino acid transport system ATP-binding protein